MTLLVLIRSLIAGLCAVAVLSACFVLSYRGEFRTAEDARAIAAPSIAKARALGARWRTDNSEASARDYARALLAAGLYDELLHEISGNGLMSGAPLESSLIRGEATLQKGRYAEAVAIAAENGDVGGNPYLAYLGGRAIYALTADAAEAAPALALALRGPMDLAAKGWLFRARIALDANDFATVEAAMRRALEAGGSRDETDDIAIEMAIRQGDLARAEGRISARSDNARHWFQASVARSPASMRLLAMARLKIGDARSAARLLEEAERSGAENIQSQLLLAFARWNAGDLAQAHRLAAKILAAAPRNWVALDLASAIASDMGRVEDAEELLSRLADVRPALAVMRRMQSASVDKDLDRIFDAVIGLEVDLSHGGGASALLGDFEGVSPIWREPSHEWRAITALAAAINHGDQRAILAAARTLTSAGETALGLTLAGRAFGILGDFDSADKAAARASILAPSFFEPVRISADQFLQSGRTGDAIRLVADFVGRNPLNEEAMLQYARLLAKSGDARASYAAFSKIRPEAAFADRATALLYAEMALSAGKVETDRMVAAASVFAGADVLGLVLAKTGNDLAATAAFRRALIAGHFDAEIESGYLGAMSRLGRAGAAKSLLAELSQRRVSLRESPNLWKSR